MSQCITINTPQTVSFPTKQLLWFVVRLPEFSYKPDAREPLKASGSLLYQGVDRMAWWDFVEPYYTHQLPADLISIYQDADARGGPTNLMACLEFEDASRLLHATPDIEKRNEVVCIIGAPYLSEQRFSNISWLGYDPIYKSGNPYTLLRETYLHPEGPLGWAVDRLNPFGLMNTLNDGECFGSQYRKLAEQEIVEPLPLFEEAFEVVAVGRPQFA